MVGGILKVWMALTLEGLPLGSWGPTSSAGTTSNPFLLVVQSSLGAFFEAYEDDVTVRGYGLNDTEHFKVDGSHSRRFPSSECLGVVHMGENISVTHSVLVLVLSPPLVVDLSKRYFSTHITNLQAYI
jgi:hypothetical protein